MIDTSSHNSSIYSLSLHNHAVAISLLKMGRHVQLFIKQYPNIITEIINATPFLLTSAGIKERCFCIINDISHPPTCKQCSALVKWKGLMYAPFCSRSCKGKSTEIKLKVKKTVNLRFGVDNPSQSSVVRDKKIATCLINHGTQYPQQNANILQKSKNSMMSKYGVERPTQHPDLFKKISSTMFTKYGTINASNIPEFQLKKRTTFQERYQRNHWTQSHISNEILNLLNNYDWVYDQHIIQQKPIIQIAQELNINGSTVKRYMRTHNIDTQHFFTSTGQRELTEFIRECLPNGEIIENTRSIIYPKEIDIYLPQQGIAIEYCGLYWHSEQMGKDRNYHKDKMIACNNKQIKLITIYDSEWIHKQDIVKSKLNHILKLKNRPKVHARKCLITTENTKSKKEFFDTYHVQGDGPSSINIGLTNNNKLIACMGLICKKNGSYIINRYATSDQISGGFSKLLSYFKKNYIWSQITTFADLRWGTGDLYLKAGFKYDDMLPPDYAYIDIKTCNIIHKFNLRRSQMKRVLSGFDESLSESENANALNIDRIWNCGLIRYTMINT